MSRWRAFLRGMGSVLTIWPAPMPMPLADEQALLDDWRAVERDLQAALPALQSPMPSEPTPLSLSAPCPLCGQKPKSITMPDAAGTDARIEHADGRECRLRWRDGRWVMA